MTGPSTTEAPDVFRYIPEASAPSSSAAAYAILVAPLFIGAGVAVAGLPDLAIPVAAGVAVVMVVQRRRRRTRPTATIAVAAGVVSVQGRIPGGSVELPLEDLHEVRLDTRTVQKVQESLSGGGVPEARYINAKVGLEHDEARIELVFDGESVLLSDERFSHTHAMDGMRELRRYLRRQGWVPLDERQAPKLPEPYR